MWKCIPHHTSARECPPVIQRDTIGEKQHVSVSLVCVNHGEVVFLWVSTMRIFGPNHLFFAQFVGLLQYILFFSIFKLFYCYAITVVCIFSPPLYPTPAKPTSFPCFHNPPWFCPCVLYSSSWKSFSPLSLPLSHLAIVTWFLTSMSPVIFCFLFSSVDYVPVKGEITWYLSLTIWLISFSIMLSSSIHAVAKGISSFFLSAA